MPRLSRLFCLLHTPSWNNNGNKGEQHANKLMMTVTSLCYERTNGAADSYDVNGVRGPKSDQQ